MKIQIKEGLTPDVAVLPGRFQVHELHEGHQQLLQYLVDNHKRVIVFLGVSATRVTRNNPLDFEARKQMLLALYPNITVMYIKDRRSDQAWSQDLDRQIRDLTGPGQGVCLYGSRDGFTRYYHGSFPTAVLEQEVFVSGTETRLDLSVATIASPQFRAGVVWAAYNQYPKVLPTVDVAIFDETRERLLLAKKPGEDSYRFVGGFADNPKESFEQAALREVREETTLEIDGLEYVCSMPVDDWRYRREVDGIVTTLFSAKLVFGCPSPQDDVEELRWWDYATLSEPVFMPEHRPLFAALRGRIH